MLEFFGSFPKQFPYCGVSFLGTGYSDGFFFVNNLANKISKNLSLFYQDYELKLEEPENNIKLDGIIKAKDQLLSLLYFLGLKEQEVYDYLDKLCILHGLSDSLWYCMGEIDNRCINLARYLLQQKGQHPTLGTYILEGSINVYTDKASQIHIKSYLFELIYLINFSTEDENKFRLEYYTEALIAYYKILLIFNIHETI